MTETGFAAALASALVPGGKLANGVEAPGAGDLLDGATLAEWLGTDGVGEAVAAIVEAAGGADAFAAAGPEARAAALRCAEAGQGPSFERLVAALLTLYYEDACVLEAFGWRAAPPQPEGHALEGLGMAD